MTAEAHGVPTAAGERVELLDVLRGFALYGVLLANTMQLFSGRAFMLRAELAARDSPVDLVCLNLIRLFVDGKAMALLTLLFGLGFAMQLQRAERSGRSVVPTHLRRLAALALIGVCHVLLVWWGDILWGYALGGLGLLLFRRVRGRRLLGFALAFIFLPRLLVSIPAVNAALAPVLAKPMDPNGFKAQFLAAILGHSRRVLTAMHLRQVYYHVGNFWVSYFPWLLGHFLFGYWIETTGIFQRIAERLPLLRKLACWGLILGTAGSALGPMRRILTERNLPLPDSLWIPLTIPFELGVLLLTCAYAAGVMLLWQRPALRRALLLVAPVGQMALTTYISQSLICTFLFYGWGLGLATHVQPLGILLLTLAVFFVQLAFARAWLRRFRFGPLEWLWRSLTYGRVQPLRRPVNANS